MNSEYCLLWLTFTVGMEVKRCMGALAFSLGVVGLTIAIHINATTTKTSNCVL